MDIVKKISLMKRSSFREAVDFAIDVSDSEKNFIGRLVPVGDWILSEKDKVELIRSWRQRNMRMFLTQFETTYEKTYDYLRRLSSSDENRILFLLFDADDRFIGHIGVTNVDDKSGELDNLIRGVDGGHPRLVYFAEICLLDWCFKYLSITASAVRVLSYNWLVMALHEEVGYVYEEVIPLLKEERDGVTYHKVVNELDSNVKYSCVKLHIERERFHSVNHWTF